MTPHQMLVMANPQQHLQFDDEYEDKDFTIYFDRERLMAYINEIQDDLLFQINQLQDQEHALEKVVTRKNFLIGKVSQDIEDVNRNIGIMTKLRDESLWKLRHLTSQNSSSDEALKFKGPMMA